MSGGTASEVSTGLLREFHGAWIRQCPDFTPELMKHFINQQESLRDILASAFEPRIEAVFALSLDVTLTIEDLVNIAGVEDSEGVLLNKHFPRQNCDITYKVSSPLQTHIAVIEGCIFKINIPMTSKELECELALNGFRHATLQELLTYSVQFPELPEQGEPSIQAIFTEINGAEVPYDRPNTTLADWEKNHYTPFLLTLRSEDSPKRIISWSRKRENYYPRYRFLAIRM